MAKSKIGRVVPLHKGTYDAATTYGLNDVVSYKGSTYWHSSHDDTTGVLPTDSTVWKLVMDATAAEPYVETAVKAAEDATDAKTAAETAQGKAEDAQTAAETAKENAETAKNGAESAKDAAVNAKTAAETARDAAQTANDNAQSAKSAAETAALNAETAKEDAQSAKSGAVDAAVAASNSASNAAGSATEAEGYKEETQTLKEQTETIKGDTETLKEQAEAAKTAAETAQGKAEDAQTAAETAEDGAVSAKESSEASAEAAKTYSEVAEAAANRMNKRYIARWNKSTAQMTRMGDAENITNTTTNFGHFGSKNSNYDNPFDLLYPWSERRLCNIDIPTYMALAEGANLTDCVVAWEGDTNFSYSHQYGVWVYTPEFWGDSWDDGDYRYYEVCDFAGTGKHYFPAQIGGRWYGCKVTLTISGSNKSCLVPTLGMPAKREAISTLHTYAKNYGATLDNIWSMDASTLLYLVEYANWNTQTKLGNGVSQLYRQSSDKIQEDSTGTTVKVLASGGNGYCIPGAIFDIGTSNGGNEVGSYQIMSVETADSVMTLTLDREVTVTTANYWSVHGLCNVADSGIGSKSGYIGTNGKAAAYYRGEEFFGNLWRYVLGVYHQATTNHVWIAKDADEADKYDAINTSVHKDTGIVLATSNNYVKSLAQMKASGLFAAPICTAIGGSSDNPVGDYFYINTGANTVLLVGGSANDDTNVGRCSGIWNDAASYSSWNYGACPLLKTP